jgi:hypothetical protein
MIDLNRFDLSGTDAEFAKRLDATFGPATVEIAKALNGAPDEAEPTGGEKQFKSLSVAFDTDGTFAGTTLTVNGKTVTELQQFGLQCSKVGKDTIGLFCSYTQGSKTGDTGDGFKPTYTYSLSKADDGDDSDSIEVDLASMVAEAVAAALE